MDLSCALEFAEFVSANNCLPDFVNSCAQDLVASEQIQNCLLLSSLAPFISFAFPLDLTEPPGAELKSGVDTVSLSASTGCVPWAWGGIAVFSHLTWAISLYVTQRLPSATHRGTH